MKQSKSHIFVFLIVCGILISAQIAQAQTGYIISYLEVNGDSLDGYSATNLYDYNFTYYYSVGVTGTLYDQNHNVLDYGSQQIRRSVCRSIYSQKQPRARTGLYADQLSYRLRAFRSL